MGTVAKKHNYKETMQFEAEVRRVAEAVWGVNPGDCQPKHYSSNPIVTELDGIVKVNDVTHLIMATTSTKLTKIKADVKKLVKAKELEGRTSPVLMWLITQNQLDAQHVNFARDQGVKALTLGQFRNRFFNGKDYIHKRRVYSFGSARNLADGSVTIKEDEYVSLPMIMTLHKSVPQDKADAVSVTVDDLVGLVLEGEIVVMVAPFGAGKSLTTREVFLRLAKIHLKDKTPFVPLAINLREHWAQDFADEILERHAKYIGFSPKQNLTIAWRSGIAMLLIDGFDEVASQVVAKSENLQFMREVRYQALTGVRDLMTKIPQGVGVLICGRDHYFDSDGEMVHSIGMNGRSYYSVRLGEFTEDQAKEFLDRHGISASLPDWLPRKPLLLGYLASKDLLAEVLTIDSSQGFGYIWDKFLTLICEREASLERAAMDPITLRRLLERLACNVRSTSSGTGPISNLELSEAYRIETGQKPADGVLMQLQRLPGLTEREFEGARSFVDEDMLNALQGSALTHLLLNEIKGIDDEWLDCIKPKGIAMASYLLKSVGADYNTVLGFDRRFKSQVVADAAMVAIEMARNEGIIDFNGMIIEGCVFGVLDIDDMIIKNLIIRNCYVREVLVGVGFQQSSVILEDCGIQRVGGVASKDGLCKKTFGSGCVIEEFDDLSTNNAVLKSGLSSSLKALITVLNKLYRQSGSGRRISALKRGIPQGETLEAVDKVIEILRSEKMITSHNGVIYPIRKETSRVLAILNAPTSSPDPLVERARSI